MPKEVTRYCESAIYILGSCEAGWGAVGVSPDGNIVYKNCHDEPKEQNCHHLLSSSHFNLEESCQTKK